MYCCARGVFCCCCFLQQRAAVCGINFKTTYGVKQNNDFGPVRTPENTIFRATLTRNPAAPKTHPLENAFFEFWKLLLHIQGPQQHQKRIRPTCQVSDPQASHPPPRRDRGVRTHASISLLRTSAVVLRLASNGDCCWKKNYKVGFVRSKIRLPWAGELLVGLGSYSF